MKVAILGTGGMGRTVINHLQQCSEIEQIIAYDFQEEALRQVEEHERTTTTLCLEDILTNPEVRLAFVTSSNAAHKSLTLQALTAGKAVMCEKPMATTLADARVMVEAAERHDSFLQIGFELRYSKLYTQVKEWIEAGLLGNVINTHCYYICSEFHHKGSWRNKKETGGSMFGEKLSHYVDLPRWWIGEEVTDVYSLCAPNVIPYYEVHDNYHTTYRFRNGAVSHLTFMMAPAATFNGDPLQDYVSQQQGDGHALRFLVVGTKGAVETDIFNRSIKRWVFGDSKLCFTSTLVENFTWDPAIDHQYFHNTFDQTRDIVRRVAQGLPPKTSARDAYETTKLCVAAELSADLDRIISLKEIE